MQDIIINLYLFVILWFTLFYIWYLTWPVVSAKVTSVDSGILEGIGISRLRKYRLLNYTYEYRGVTYHSRRQGLITARAFSLDAKVDDLIQVRVCTLFQSLSCLSRMWFEAKVVLFSILVLTILASVIYVLPPL